MSYEYDKIIETNEASSFVLSSTFSILSVNVCSLNKHDTIFKQLIHELNEPTILCVSETWNASESACSITNYNHVINKRSSRGGGTAIWFQNNLQTRSLDVLQNLQLKLIEFSHLVLNMGTHEILVLSIYRAPNRNLVQSLKEMVCLLETCERTNLQVFISGDTNINLLKSNNNTENYLSILQNFQYRQLVNSPTRISSNSISIIDHQLVNTKVSSASSYVVNSQVADHLPVLTITNMKKKPDKNPLEQSKDRKKIDIDMLISRLKSVHWDSWIDKRLNCSADAAFSALYRLLKKFLKESEFFVKSKKKKYSPRNPWISSSSIDTKKKVDKLRNKYLKSKNAVHLESLNSLHKQYKSQLKADKMNFYLQKLKVVGRNSKAVWSLINEVIGRNPKSNEKPQIPKLKIGDKDIEDPAMVCEQFNRYYKVVAKDLESKIPKSKVPFNDYLKLSSNALESLQLKPVVEQDVLKVVKNLKNKNSSGSDDISNSILKKIAPFIVTPLTFCINRCISVGSFPSELKTSKVLPLYKGGMEHSCNNYRPISQLSSLSKIFEKTIFEQASEFLNSNNITHELQFGFRPNHSCSHAVLKTVCELEAAKNKNLFTILVSIDLRKAFDTVNVSEILPAKLKHYFGNEKTCNFLSSFFTDRKQYVKINDAQSSVVNSYDIGVIQGSSLGPPCFSLYINDLPNITGMRCILFADDTSLLLSGPNLKELETKTNYELEKIADYLRANKLSLNASKTTYVIVPPKNRTVKDKLVIKIDNNIITEVDEFKFLGVLIHKNLKFKNHFELVKKKVKKGVNCLIYSKNFLNYKAKITLYHALIHSHLSYCSLVWLPKISNAQLDELSKLQKKALRAIFKTKYNSHTNKLHELSHITKVSDIFQKESIKLMYLNKECLTPTAISKLIRDHTTLGSIRTRNQQSDQTVSIVGFRKGDLLYDLIQHWNNCNLSLKNSTYEIKSINKRIHSYQSQNYKACDKAKCYNCFCSKESYLLEEYMNF